MKSIYKSRTFWLAIAQCIVAVVAVLESHYQIGGILIIKSMADIVVRVMSTATIKM